MSVYASLARLYIQGFYNLPGKRAPGDKPTAKEIIKAVGFGALIVLLVGDFGFLFVMMNLGMYEGLALAGLQGLLILNAAVLATMLTLIAGFMTALSTYYLNDMELQLLSMPIKPRALFGAKFTAVYLSEAVVSVFFIGIAMVIFGIKESPNPLFYLWGIIAGVLLPLPALAVSYLIQIPLLSVARFLKNKKAIMMVGGVLGLVFALGFNVYFQGMMARLNNPEAMAGMVAGPDSLITAIGNAYPPALFAWKAMSDPASIDALGWMLALVAICVAGPALVVYFLSGAYARSLLGFNEAHLKKLTKAGADAFIVRYIRGGSAFRSLVMREFNMMNREPLYLLNGPFVVVLMPLILGIMLVVQKDMLLSDPDMAGILALINGGFGAVLAGLAGGMLGSFSSITCTAVSRDAKALPFIKSLPVKAGTYMLAKLAHGLIFAVIGSVIGVGLVAMALKLGFVDIISGLVVSLSLSALLNMGGLWLDTANPRLSWDNPIAAMKQNPNSVIAILAAMGLMAGTGWLAFKLSMETGSVLLWFGALPVLAFGILLVLYPNYAEKRLARMEA